jgi:hypothetical protein
LFRKGGTIKDIARIFIESPPIWMSELALVRIRREFNRIMEVEERKRG